VIGVTPELLAAFPQEEKNRLHKTARRLWTPEKAAPNDRRFPLRRPLRAPYIAR
jgi:hypothetical protein